MFRIRSVVLLLLCLVFGGSAWAEEPAHQDGCTLEHDATGAAFYRLLPPIDADAPDVALAEAGPLAELTVPILHSRPGAEKKIYLDFDGHVVSGTLWNSYNDDNPIHAQPYSTDPDVFSFSAKELANIVEIWKRVAEDFAPFDVDVTTEDPGLAAFTAGGKALRVLISTDVDSVAMGGTGKRWYEDAGGVAYIGSWNWDSDTPVWVYENNLGNGFPKYVAEAVSHEVGHALLLGHDGTDKVSYYEGHGGGDTAWAPIMGVAYDRGLTQWSKGEYPHASNTEDDLAIISGLLGYVDDDHGDLPETAGPVTLLTPTAVHAEGVIHHRSDVDLFAFTTGAGEVIIDAIPYNYPTKGYANLDLSVSLYDSDGVLLESSNPETALNASVSRFVPAGTYYISVTGVGKGDLSNGYSDYGSLGWYTISGTIQDAAGVPDTGAPKATLLSISDIKTTTASPKQFSVRYSDLGEIDVTTIDNADIRVTGPGGYSEAATLVSVDDNTNGTPRTAVYQVSAPGGVWDYLDNGSYSVNLLANGVADISGNYAAAEVLGEFQVIIHEAPALVTQPVDVTVESGQTVLFTCSAQGSGPITYRWQKDGSTIEGASGTNYTRVVSLLDDKSKFRCIAQNAYGNTYSRQATLRVNPSSTKYSISGRITHAGEAVRGVTVTLQEVTTRSTVTNSNGEFSFSGLSNGVPYKVSASEAHYTFTPKTRSGKINGSSVSGVLFSASCAQGYVFENGRCRLDLYLIDSDGDGISDGLELELGLDPYNPDSDNDGSPDGEELQFGSNPLDRGSVLRVASGRVCSEWNGFLQPMFQVKELLNASPAAGRLQSALYSIDGVLQSTFSTSLPPLGKFDLLVHQLGGFAENTYGRLCTSYPAENALDGGMVFYKYPYQGADPLDISFAFMAPFLPPVSDSLFVGFNTFQPSLRFGHQDNLVTNWIQLSNSSDSKRLDGWLLFYAQAGNELLCRRYVSLAPGHRFDTPAHRPVPGDEAGCSKLGPNIVGYVQWQPNSSKIPAQMRNVRYVYDNPSGAPSFTTAFQLEAEAATGEEISVVVDTRDGTAVLEVTNVLAKPHSIDIFIYDENGALVAPLSRMFAARETVHFTLDQLLVRRLGLAVIRGGAPESVLAVAMEYGREPDGALKWMYGLLARQPFGSELNGGLNSFLAQGCRVLLGNPGDSDVTATLRLISASGEPLQPDQLLVVPARGVYEASCNPGQADIYGVVSVEARQNSLVGAIIRDGYADRYRFPTPLRPSAASR